jgi:hypothetical protein
MPDGRRPLSSPTVITAGTTVDLASAVFPVARSAISISAGCGGVNPDLTTDEICRLEPAAPLPEEDAKEVRQLGIVRVLPERLSVQALSSPPDAPRDGSRRLLQRTPAKPPLLLLDLKYSGLKPFSPPAV